jgi:hypothetical protein
MQLYVDFEVSLLSTEIQLDKLIIIGIVCCYESHGIYLTAESWIRT